MQAATGALVWAATPGLGGHAWVGCIALVPLLLSLHHLSGVAAFAWGLLGGLIYIIPGKWQTFANAAAANPSLPLPEFILVLAFFLLYASPIALFALWWGRSCARRPGWLTPWISGFGLAALITLTPTIFPFTPVVTISGAPLLLQLADLGGEPVLLGLLLTLQSGVALAIVHRRAGPAAWAGPVLAMAVPLGLSASYGGYRLSQPLNAPAQTVRVAGLQAHWPRMSGNRVLLRDRKDLAPKSAVELTRAVLAEHPSCEVVIWPETPTVQTRDLTCVRAKDLAAEYGRPVLATCTEEHGGESVQAAHVYGATGIAGTHVKIRLIPGYERSVSDWRGWFPAKRTADVFDPGDVAPFSASICYEIHFSGDLRAATRAGATWLSQSSNFNVFRSPLISELDLAMTRLRAVENRRAIVRSVNAGVAGLVLPSGRWQSDLDRGAVGASCHDVPIRHELSIYTRHGDRPFWLLATLLVLAGMHRRGRPPVWGGAPNDS